MSKSHDVLPAHNGDDALMARLLDHGIHEENIFYSRLNFFLVFESVLLGSVVQTATASGVRVRNLQILALSLGLAVLIVWVIAQNKKLKYLKCLEKRLAKRLPEFKEIDEGIGCFETEKGSANRMITYSVPLFIFLAWVGIALALWC
jgi:hypothetical protein